MKECSTDSRGNNWRRIVSHQAEAPTNHWWEIACFIRKKLLAGMLEAGSKSPNNMTSRIVNIVYTKSIQLRIENFRLFIHGNHGKQWTTSLGEILWDAPRLCGSFLAVESWRGHGELFFWGILKGDSTLKMPVIIWLFFFHFEIRVHTPTIQVLL